MQVTSLKIRAHNTEDHRERTNKIRHKARTETSGANNHAHEAARITYTTNKRLGARAPKSETEGASPYNRDRGRQSM